MEKFHLFAKGIQEKSIIIYMHFLNEWKYEEKKLHPFTLYSAGFECKNTINSDSS